MSKFRLASWLRPTTSRQLGHRHVGIENQRVVIPREEAQGHDHLTVAELMGRRDGTMLATATWPT